MHDVYRCLSWQRDTTLFIRLVLSFKMTDKSKPIKIEAVTPSSNLGQHQQFLRNIEDIARTENDEGFRTWAKNELQHKTKLRILSTGKVGTGKSSLLNALVGSKFAIGHSLDPKTTKVAKYEYKQDDVDVVAWDCPGLQDGTNHEEEYLEDMVEKTTKDGGIDILLYCIRMDDTRSDLHIHTSAMKMLTERLGQDIWNNSLIVLTFANMYVYQLKLITEGEDTDSEEHRKKFNDRMEHWKEKVTEQLKQMNVAENIIEKICMCPAGYYCQKSLDLPGYECWRSNLWAHAYSAAEDDCKPVLLKLNADRFEICTDNINAAPRVPAQNDHPERHTIYVTPSFIEIITTNKKSIIATGVAAAGGGTALGASGAVLFVKFTTLSTAMAIGAGAAVGGVGAVAIAAGLLYTLYQKKKNKDKKDS